MSASWLHVPRFEKEKEKGAQSQLHDQFLCDSTESRAWHGYAGGNAGPTLTGFNQGFPTPPRNLPSILPSLLNTILSSAY